MTVLGPRYVAFIVCCVSIGCESPTKPITGCLGDVPIEISSSREATPGLRFSWSPPCGISTLTVSTVPGPGASPLQVWSLTAPELTPMGPTITYGVTPRGATALHAAVPLVHGLTYRVNVSYVVGGDAIAASGQEIFSY